MLGCSKGRLGGKAEWPRARLRCLLAARLEVEWLLHFFPHINEVLSFCVIRVPGPSLCSTGHFLI